MRAVKAIWNFFVELWDEPLFVVTVAVAAVVIVLFTTHDFDHDSVDGNTTTTTTVMVCDHVGTDGGRTICRGVIAPPGAYP